MTFPLPSTDSGDYYVTAFSPIIKNPSVVHHMIIYQCGPTEDVSEINVTPSAGQ